MVNPQVSNGSVTLYYLGNGTETRVAVKGSFDEDWGVLHEMTNESSSNIWSVTIDVEKGNYEYGIVTWSPETADQEWGDWQGDPLNPKHSEEGNFTSNALLTVGEGSDTDLPNQQDKKVVKVRFIKEGETKYDNWGFWTWYPGQNGKFIEFDYVDKEGAYTLLELPANVTEGQLGIIVKEGHGWDNKATGNLEYEISELNNDNNEIVVTYGDKENPKSVEQRAFIKEYENINLNIHYKRSQKDYDNWNLWTWLDGADGEKVEFTSENSCGKVATKVYKNLVNDTKLGFIVKRTEGDNEWAEKDVENNRFIDLRHVSSDGTLDIYLSQGKEAFSYHSALVSKEITDLDGQVNGDMLYHNTWDSLYKYPFGAVAKGTDVTVRMHAQKGDLQYARVLVRNTNTNRSDLYNMEKVSTITLHEEEVDIWEGTFTPDEIGVYGYKFIAGDGDAVKYYCEDGNEGKQEQ